MTFWMYWLRKKNIANIAAGAKNIAAKLAARVRLVKTRTGSSGCSTRLSTSTNSAEQRDAGDQAGERPRVAPAAPVAGAADAVDDAEQAERCR